MRCSIQYLSILEDCLIFVVQHVVIIVSSDGCNLFSVVKDHLLPNVSESCVAKCWVVCKTANPHFCTIATE